MPDETVILNGEFMRNAATLSLAFSTIAFTVALLMSPRHMAARGRQRVRSGQFLLRARRGEFRLLVIAALIAGGISVPILLGPASQPAQAPLSHTGDRAAAFWAFLTMFALYTSMSVNIHVLWREYKTLTPGLLSSRGISNLRLEIWRHWGIPYAWWYGSQRRYRRALRAFAHWFLRQATALGLAILAANLFMHWQHGTPIVLPLPQASIIADARYLFLDLVPYCIIGGPWAITAGVIAGFVLIKVLYVREGFDSATKALYDLRDLPLAYGCAGTGDKLLLVRQDDIELPYAGRWIFPQVGMENIRAANAGELERRMANRFTAALTTYGIQVRGCRYSLESTVKFYDDQDQEDWHWAHVFSLDVVATHGQPPEAVWHTVADAKREVPEPFVSAIDYLGNGECRPPYRFWAPPPAHYLIMRSRPH